MSHGVQKQAEKALDKESVISTWKAYDAKRYTFELKDEEKNKNLQSDPSKT